MDSNPYATCASPQVKTTKNEGSNIEQMFLPFRIRTQYRAYVFIRLKKDKKCIRPVIHTYGIDPEEIYDAAAEAFDRVRIELIHKGYNVAPLNSKSEEGGVLSR